MKKQLLKVGVVLNDLSLSQKLFCAVDRLHTLIEKSNQYDACLFIKDMTYPSIKPRFSTMFFHEMWNFDGYLIATDIDSAEQVIKTTNQSKKIFYIWDLEWLRNKTDYVKNVDILRDKSIKLIARSESHAEMIQKYCGVKPDVVENFNIKEILEI